MAILPPWVASAGNAGAAASTAPSTPQPTRLKVDNLSEVAKVRLRGSCEVLTKGGLVHQQELPHLLCDATKNRSSSSVYSLTFLSMTVVLSVFINSVQKKLLFL